MRHVQGAELSRSGETRLECDSKGQASRRESAQRDDVFMRGPMSFSRSPFATLRTGSREKWGPLYIWASGFRRKAVRFHAEFTLSTEGLGMTALPPYFIPACLFAPATRLSARRLASATILRPCHRFPCAAGRPPRNDSPLAMTRFSPALHIAHIVHNRARS
jgi:hypothetical protein